MKGLAGDPKRSEAEAWEPSWKQTKGEGKRTVAQLGLCKGVPLTITPPLEKHRLDAEVVGSRISWKGIVLKVTARMQRGVAGFFL